MPFIFTISIDCFVFPQRSYQFRDCFLLLVYLLLSYRTVSKYYLGLCVSNILNVLFNFDVHLKVIWFIYNQSVRYTVWSVVLRERCRKKRSRS